MWQQNIHTNPLVSAIKCFQLNVKNHGIEAITSINDCICRSPNNSTFFYLSHGILFVNYSALIVHFSIYYILNVRNNILLQNVIFHCMFLNACYIFFRYFIINQTNIPHNAQSFLNTADISIIYLNFKYLFEFSLDISAIFLQMMIITHRNVIY